VIQIAGNGEQRRIDPRSTEQLRDAVLGEVPAGHGVARLRVNGQEFVADRWAELDLGQVREVELRSVPLRELAHGAIAETQDWISRICGVLESIAGDYRRGQEGDANGRLAAVSDALYVLTHLLCGIRAQGVDASRGDLSARWVAAEEELSAALDAMASDLTWRDPVALSDHTGYALPRTLQTFQDLLKELAA